MTGSYAYPEVVVTTQWVSEHVDDPGVVLVEVDTDPEAGYNQGHVPGAIVWALHTDLEDQVRRDLPGLAQIEGLLGRSGINNQTTIALYGDGNNRSATWAFWVLKYYRHEDVLIMNGGRSKWTDEGRPLSTDIPLPALKRYKASTPDRSIRAIKDYILSNLGNQRVKLLDTRTHEEYSGLLTSAPGTHQTDVYRKGRIPGAVNIPWDDGVADDGTFKTEEEMRRLFSDKGLDPDQEVISYCRLGIRASYSWFVLKYLLGYSRVRNYDGSWTEWGNVTGVPIETDTLVN